MVLSRSAVYPLSHGLKALKLQHTHELLSPTMKGLPCVVRADRQQQGCHRHFVKRMARHRVHRSMKLPGQRVGGTRLLNA